MTAEDNKRVVSDAMQALADGDPRPFSALMHADFVWTVTGTNSWSGNYRGREAVRRDLIAPLFENFSTTYRNQPVNIFADGDFVIVECRGEVMTKSGRPYNNVYCWVIRMEGGKMMSLTEYMDTELVAKALGPRCHA